jgi:AraC-like DNA-binding protein
MIEAVSFFTFFLVFVAVKNNWNRNRTIIYLALSIGLYSLFVLTHKVVVYSTDATLVAIFYAHFTPLFYLVGPFLYFYFRSITRDQWELKKTDWIHSLPSLITIIGLAPYYLDTPWEDKLQIANNFINDFDNYKNLNISTIVPSVVSTYLRPVLLIGYLGASIFIVVRKHLEKKSEENPKILSHYLVTQKWSYFILIIVALSVVSYIIVLNMFYTFGIETAKDKAYNWQFMSAVLFALIPISMLYYPQLVYGFITLEHDRQIIERHKWSTKSSIDDQFKRHGVENVLRDSESPIEPFDNESRKAIASGLLEEPSSLDADDDLSELKQAIVSYFEDEAPYLNHKLKVADVATYLGVPPHHISFCFSVAFDENFVQYKTRYRIDHAVKLLQENASDRYSIEAIGNMSGFASKSNFFKAFKQATGMTPQEYILRLQTESRSEI